MFLLRLRSLHGYSIALQRIAGGGEGDATIFVVANEFFWTLLARLGWIDVLGQHVCWSCCATDPLDILLLERLQPLPSVSSHDECEKIANSVIIVWDGGDDLAFPFGIQQVQVVVRKISWLELGVVVKEMSELP